MERDRARSSALTEFLKTEQAAGAAMVLAAGAAIIWATLRPEGYVDFWSSPLTLPLPALDHFTLKLWIDDGLMTLFFFVAGLEIKRELSVGELSEGRAAALPVLAAAGGMLMPALIYAAVNVGEPTMRGWAIATATDIAFVVGVCALLGSRVPPSSRMFLLTLAIADDIGGIIIIAIVFATAISGPWIAAAAAGAGAVLVLQRLGVRAIWAYVPLGAWIWYATLLSGVHPAIAGVAVGLLTPVGPFRGDDVMARIEARLHPYTSFVVAPVFALANAGVALSTSAISAALGAPVFWGVLLGLVVGKPVGISAITWIGMRTRAVTPTAGMTLKAISSASPLAGIGFTVALFLATLAIEDPAARADALLGILVASVLAALAGWVSLTVSARRSPPAT